MHAYFFVLYLYCEQQCIECTDGDVLLYNGSHLLSNASEGTVLVCFNNTYHSVCDDFWDELEARVVCRQLGFDETGMQNIPEMELCSSTKCIHSLQV